MIVMWLHKEHFPDYGKTFEEWHKAIQGNGSYGQGFLMTFPFVEKLKEEFLRTVDCDLLEFPEDLWEQLKAQKYINISVSDAEYHTVFCKMTTAEQFVTAFNTAKRLK